VPPVTRAQARTAETRKAADLPGSLQRRYGRALRAEMERAIGARDLPLRGMIRYHMGMEEAPSPSARGVPAGAGTGKMLRPLLCLLCCEAVRGDYRRALPAAAALELLHNFTLVHDDIQDESPSRHGRATVWRIWGLAQAINVGDGLYAMAHLAMLRLVDVGVAAGVVAEAARLLDEACLRVCEGQHLDLAFEERLDVTCDEYLEMVGHKTAALLAASAALGALLGEAPEETVAALRAFGRELGLAFQIQDDILGIWGESRETGKPAGEDILSRKKSFPVVYALEQAVGRDRERLLAAYAKPSMGSEDAAAVGAVLERAGARARSEEAARQHTAEALRRLEGLDLVPARRRDLEAFAAYVTERRR
jgi:geranylgeranyl diphosphate synthase type I